MSGRIQLDPVYVTAGAAPEDDEEIQRRARMRALQGMQSPTDVSAPPAGAIRIDPFGVDSAPQSAGAPIRIDPFHVDDQPAPAPRVTNPEIASREATLARVEQQLSDARRSVAPSRVTVPTRQAVQAFDRNAAADAQEDDARTRSNDYAAAERKRDRSRAVAGITGGIATMFGNDPRLADQAMSDADRHLEEYKARRRQELYEQSQGRQAVRQDEQDSNARQDRQREEQTRAQRTDPNSAYNQRYREAYERALGDSPPTDMNVEDAEARALLETSGMNRQAAQVAATQRTQMADDLDRRQDERFAHDEEMARLRADLNPRRGGGSGGGAGAGSAGPAAALSPEEAAARVARLVGKGVDPDVANRTGSMSRVAIDFAEQQIGQGVAPTQAYRAALNLEDVDKLDKAWQNVGQGESVTARGVANQTAGRAERLGVRLQGLEEARIAVRDAQDSLGRMGDDDIRALLVTRSVPPGWKPDQYARAQGRLMSVINRALRDQSGAAVTSTEERRFLEAASAGHLGNPAALRDWIHRYQETLDGRIGAFRAGAGTGATAYDNNATSSRGGASAPAAPAGQIMIRLPGGSVRPGTREALQRMRANGVNAEEVSQ